MGDLPASLAVRSGLPVKAVAVDLPIGASEYLLAKPGITAISQLRGKPVAYTTGTAEQAFALRALKSAGLTRGVHQVNVSLLELGTVLESGAADASVVSVEQKVDYQQAHPTAKVLANVDTVSPPSYGYLLATTAALAQSGQAGRHQRPDPAADPGPELGQDPHQSQWVTDYYVDVEHQIPAAARLILAAGGTQTYEPITPAVSRARSGRRRPDGGGRGLAQDLQRRAAVHRGRCPAATTRCSRRCRSMADIVAPLAPPATPPPP